MSEVCWVTSRQMSIPIGIGCFPMSILPNNSLQRTRPGRDFRPIIELPGR